MDGVFAVYKPSGATSAQFIGEIQKLFTASDVFSEDLNKAKEKARYDLSSNKTWSKQKVEKKVRDLKVKIGHGGTLDPLASGVLVIGVGLGTKKLQHYLTECRKQYRTKALLGISTTTGDSEGEIITQNKIDHVTKQMITETGPKFVGNLKQTPPIFSALKINGLPFYEYARKGIPLPAPIKTREIQVHGLEIHEEDSLKVDHEFNRLQSQLDEDGKPKEHGLANNPTLNDSPLYFSSQYLEKAEKEGLSTEVSKPKLLDEGEILPEKLPMIHFTADVSSGTYIRSLVSDFGRALESSAYMVELIRTAQSDWKLGKNVFTIEDFKNRDERIWGPVLKKVLEQGSDVDVEEELNSFSEKILPLIEKEQEVLAQKAKQEQEAENAEKPEVTESDEQPQKAAETTDESAVPKKRHIDEVEN
ncbi:pseudouridine synthase [Suhomyces tanzawaensis NRRL Y-17324]|uniref:tRNA pseudouridine(55) synthase n=1 Tax=Suhomyces tanzawaensis NRRL Y-17324 TaxID=984487 RepID=A0A1E4SQ10_9ASCO|nr:pseudouridine synthase [Suhomyces tanzawaensis NRRL Y-17324]ODV81603.1 pseudouridine synthase [Suhomyces tanzawaensis NRRL Y-17324]